MISLILRPTLAWLALIVLTVGSIILSEWRQSDDGSSRIQVCIIVLLACLKIRIVMRQFMEIDKAPLTLRAALDVWILSVGVMVVTALTY